MSIVLCRMPNGTVARIATHHSKPNTAGFTVALPLSPRQQAIMHAAVRVTAPDANGNASQQTKRRV